MTTYNGGYVTRQVDAELTDQQRTILTVAVRNPNTRAHYIAAAIEGDDSANRKVVAHILKAAHLGSLHERATGAGEAVTIRGDQRDAASWDELTQKQQAILTVGASLGPDATNEDLARAVAENDDFDFGVSEDHARTTWEKYSHLAPTPEEGSGDSADNETAALLALDPPAKTMLPVSVYLDNAGIGYADENLDGLPEWPVGVMRLPYKPGKIERDALDLAERLIDPPFEGLSDSEGMDDVDLGTNYYAVVNNTVDYGVFVNLNHYPGDALAQEMASGKFGTGRSGSDPKRFDTQYAVTALVHKSTLGGIDPHDLTVGDALVVHADELDDGDLSAPLVRVVNATRSQLDGKVGSGFVGWFTSEYDLSAEPDVPVLASVDRDEQPAPAADSGTDEPAMTQSTQTTDEDDDTQTEIEGDVATRDDLADAVTQAIAPLHDLLEENVDASVNVLTAIEDLRAETQTLNAGISETASLVEETNDAVREATAVDMQDDTAATADLPPEFAYAVRTVNDLADDGHTVTSFDVNFGDEGVSLSLQTEAPDK